MIRSWPQYCIVLLLSLVLVLVISRHCDASNDRNSGNLVCAAEDEVQEIQTTSGAMIQGRVVSISDSTILVQTSYGELNIPVDELSQVRTWNAGHPESANRKPRDPNRTRLFLGTTGRMLRKGEGYFADYVLFFPFLAYGITDRVTVGAGISLFPGTTRQILYFTPKVGLIQNDEFSLATGAMIVRLPNSSSVGLGYGVGTWTWKAGSVTAGLGYGYDDGKLADKPLVTGGFEIRAGGRISIISENWQLPGVDHVLTSLGVRFKGTSLAADLAFIHELGADYGLIPFVDFAYSF